MSVRGITYEQQRATPSIDLSEHAGKWVLTRNGDTIIGSGGDPTSVLLMPEANEHDLLTLVPGGTVPSTFVP